MKKLIVFTLLAFVFQSCLTVGMIERNCDKFTQVCVTDSQTETIIEYRDTTIYITDTLTVDLPNDTVSIRDTVIINEQGAQYDKVVKTFGVISVSALLHNSFLHVNAWLNDSTILVPYKDSVVLQNSNTTTTHTEYIELPPERYIPKFYRFTFWWFITTVFAGVFFVVIKVYSKQLKILIDKIIK